MTVPALAAQRFLGCLGVGLLLGVVYSFLQPPGRRFRHLTDGIFVIFLAAAWIYSSFAICRGDIRLGGTAALLLGVVLWEKTAGRLLRPIFRGIWKILGLPLVPVKKFLEISRLFAKKCFATGKKWVTIKCKNGNKGGARHEPHQEVSQADPSGLPPQHNIDQGRGAVRRGPVFHGSDRAAAVHRRKP